MLFMVHLCGCDNRCGQPASDNVLLSEVRLPLAEA